jgi:hypothetical protein
MKRLRSWVGYQSHLSGGALDVERLARELLALDTGLAPPATNGESREAKLAEEIRAILGEDDQDGDEEEEGMSEEGQRIIEDLEERNTHKPGRNGNGLRPRLTPTGSPLPPVVPGTRDQGSAPRSPNRGIRTPRPAGSAGY